MHRVVVMPRARRQVLAATEMVACSRDKAPTAFEDDFSEALDLVARNASIGHLVHMRRKGIRRLLMERLRYYVYYRVTPDEVIEVLSVWHASRRPPHL